MGFLLQGTRPRPGSRVGRRLHIIRQHRAREEERLQRTPKLLRRGEREVKRVREGKSLDSEREAKGDIKYEN